MVDGPVLVEPPEALQRVERGEQVLKYSRITADRAALDGAGNRFDVPGAGVLYAASTVQGALAETAAEFRLSASVLERMRRVGATMHELEIPTLDDSWRARRVIRTLRARDALPFVDIEAAETHTYLTEHARSVLLGLGVQSLDVSLVRGRSRLLTRGLATWLYQAKDSVGDLLYGGVRYLSKLSSEYECWAIFDGGFVELLDERGITIDDADLVAVSTRHGIPLS